MGWARGEERGATPARLTREKERSAPPEDAVKKGWRKKWSSAVRREELGFGRWKERKAEAKKKKTEEPNRGLSTTFYPNLRGCMEEDRRREDIFLI